MRVPPGAAGRVALWGGMCFLFPGLPLPGAIDTFADAQRFLRARCAACHAGQKPSGGLALAAVAGEETLQSSPRTWARVARRVRDGEMPPKSTVPAAERERFAEWVDRVTRQAACVDGLSPRAMPLKRLNRTEYAATVRDLLGIEVNAGAGLPSDGAGGEGFDNAAETLIVSPIHAEKFLEAARLGLDYAFKDPRSRAKFLVSDSDARKALEAFVPRAFVEF